MTKIRLAALVSILVSSVVFAQNNRSAVSLTGNDLATCTVPDPCRTFGVAMSKTNAGGEVIVLSSAGYGPFTVTKSISVISPPAYHAALAPTSGDAITVNVDNAVVVLRGLTLNGSLGGNNGITFAGAATTSNSSLYIENCVISGFINNGVNFARNGVLYISNLIARQNANAAILADSNSTFASTVTIDHALLEGNNTALDVENATVAIRQSVAGKNYVGFWAFAVTSGVTAVLSADNCQATHNSYGFVAGSGSGSGRLTVSNSVASSNSSDGVFASSNGTVRASNVTASENIYGFRNSGGVFRSRGDNTVDGNNGADTVGTITTFGPV